MGTNDPADDLTEVVKDSALSDDELDELLTPEEREAAESDPGRPEPKAARDDDDGDDPDEEDDDDGDEDEGDDTPPAAAQEAAAPPAPVLPPRPDFTADQEARLTAAAAEKAALIEEFDVGGVTSDAFKTKLAALDGEIVTLSTAKARLEDWTSTVKQTDEQAWQQAIGGFMGQNPALFAGFQDGATAEQQRVSEAFDGIVMSFTESGLSTGLTHAEILDECRTLFERRYPGVIPAAGKRQQKRDAPAVRTDPRPAPPKTLARVPSSDLPAEDAGGDGEVISRMDKLADSDPQAYEEAIANMTDAQEAAFLRKATSSGRALRRASRR